MELLSVTPNRINAKMRSSVFSNSFDFGYTFPSSISKLLNDSIKLGYKAKKASSKFR